MSTASGFIRVYRSVLENPIWTGHEFSRGQAWLDLLLLAAWKDEQAFDGAHLQRGQICASLRYLAGRWKWGSKNRVGRFLKKLVELEMITLEMASKADQPIHIITLLNYDTYQTGSILNGPPADQQRTSERTKSGPATDHLFPYENQECVNNKRTSDGPPSERKADQKEERSNEVNKTLCEHSELNEQAEKLYQAYPKKVAKAASLKAIMAVLKSGSPAFDDLFSKVQQFAASPAGRAGRFTPHASSWFNGRRFEDDATEWKQSGTVQSAAAIQTSEHAAQIARLQAPARTIRAADLR